MLRILRAFAWLRWRILLNALEGRGSRDRLERSSAALEQIGRIVLALMMIPSALALSATGFYAGWRLAGPDASAVTFDMLRVLLLAGSGLAVVGPFILPGSERSHAVRLLLLPISHGVLYAARAVSALAEPWVLLPAAALAAVPIGLAAGGHPTAALIATAGGMLLIAALVGLTAAVTSAAQLVVRNRGRGELLALLLMLGLAGFAFLSGLAGGGTREARAEARAAARAQPPPAWRSALARTGTAVLPSETYAAATRAAAASESRAALVPLSMLAAAAVLLHGLSFGLFGRVLASTGTIGARRTAAGPLPAAWRVPGVSPGVSAVAINQVRLAFRTPRGRLTVLMPMLMFLVLAVALLRSPAGVQYAFVRFETGVGLAAFASFGSLLAILPLAVNQFAIDRAGLTLALLAPIDTRALLAGKALGNALVVSIPATVCSGTALLLFPSGGLTRWLSVPLALAAAYLLAAPVAAALSAVFPRKVDMNSIGRGSNAHGTAGLLGTMTFLAAGAPCLILYFVAGGMLNRPALAPVLLLAWAAVCAAMSLVLFRVVAALFDRRRENLSMLG